MHAKLNTAEGLRQGRTKAKEGRKVLPVPDADVERTLRHLPPVLQAMVRTQRLTGARPAEVCRLRPCDVDRSGAVWWYRPARHKTEAHGIDRVIAIGPKAQDVLRPYLLRHEAAPCFSPLEAVDQRMDEKHERRKTPLSCGTKPTGRRDSRIRPFYDAGSYRRAIHRVCHVKGIPRWSPNQLRHTRATEVRAESGYEAARHRPWPRDGYHRNLCREKPTAGRCSCREIRLIRRGPGRRWHDCSQTSRIGCTSPRGKILGMKNKGPTLTRRRHIEIG